MRTRIIVSILTFCWIACTVTCNGVSQDVVRKYETGDKVYQTLLDRIEKLENMEEGHEAALNRIAELEKIVKRHPAEMEAVKLELRKEINMLRESHAGEIVNLKFKFSAAKQSMGNSNELYRAAKISKIVSKTLNEFQDESGDSTDDIEVKNILALNQTDHIKERITNMTVENKDKRMERIPGQSMHLGSAVQQTNRIRRYEGEMVVAFFATLSATTSHLGQHQNVKFDTVITNVGNAYDPHLGAFRAPVSGVYVFSTTMVAEGRTDTHFGLYRNNQQLTYLWVHGSENGYDGSSNTVVVHLGQNDDVAVQHIDSDKSIYGNKHCMFSGFLVSQDDPSLIVGK